MASSNGSARAVPAPRKTVRRVKCFLLMNMPGDSTYILFQRGVDREGCRVSRAFPVVGLLCDGTRELRGYFPLRRRYLDVGK